MPSDLMTTITQLISRLERISADSIWAHRSSGYRGNLLRWAGKLEKMPDPLTLSQGELNKVHSLIDASYDILEKAAKEIIK